MFCFRRFQLLRSLPPVVTCDETETRVPKTFHFWAECPSQVKSSQVCTGYRAGTGVGRGFGRCVVVRVCVVGFVSWFVWVDGCEVRPCDPCARVRARVSRVSRVCPGSPRCLFTGALRVFHSSACDFRAKYGSPTKARATHVKRAQTTVPWTMPIKLHLYTISRFPSCRAARSPTQSPSTSGSALKVAHTSLTADMPF